MKDYSVLLTCGETAMVIIHDAFDKGYQQGYEDGKADTPFTDTEEAEEKAYDRGLNDMWEVIKKVMENEDKGGYSIKMLRKLFGSYDVYNITHNYIPEETLAKIKEYEDKQKQDDWRDIPSDKMTLEQARRAVKELRAEVLAEMRGAEE